MTVVSPQLEALKKEGESGRRKITQYTRYGTLALALFQALGICDRARVAAGPGDRSGPRVPLHHRDHAGDRHHVPDVAGRADHRARHRQRHLADHFRRHRRGLPHAIGGTLELVRTGAMSIPLGAAHRSRSVRRLVTAFVVFVERGQRKILVNYAKRQVGQQGLRRAELAPAAQAQHVGRDPADLRLRRSSCSRRRWPAGSARSERHDLAARTSPATLSPGQPIYVLLYAVGDHVLLLLLHGAACSTRRRRRTT